MYGTVPSAVHMQEGKGMRACINNNMCNPSLHLFYCGVMHVIIVACPHPFVLLHIKSENISMKMLKEVGITVPKSRETSAVCMQQDSNTYAARQGMRACKNNMCNPIIKEM